MLTRRTSLVMYNTISSLFFKVQLRIMPFTKPITPKVAPRIDKKRLPAPSIGGNWTASRRRACVVSAPLRTAWSHRSCVPSTPCCRGNFARAGTRAVDSLRGCRYININVNSTKTVKDDLVWHETWSVGYHISSFITLLSVFPRINTEYVVDTIIRRLRSKVTVGNKLFFRI